MSLADFIARRRAGLRAEAEAEAPVPPAPEVATPEAVEAALPDPDTLVAGDDFTAFMGRAVSSQLRTRALRKLWRTNPVLACVDGLNDYDDDYRAMAAGQGVLKTTYEVGRGLKRHLEHIAPVAAEAPAPDPDPAPPPAADSAPSPDAALEVATAEPVETEVSDAPTPAPRRMRFTVPGETA